MGTDGKKGVRGFSVIRESVYGDRVDIAVSTSDLCTMSCLLCGQSFQKGEYRLCKITVTGVTVWFEDGSEETRMYDTPTVTEIEACPHDGCDGWLDEDAFEVSE